MQFYYVPFKGIDYFSIGLYEKCLTQEVRKNFKKVISIRTERALAVQMKRQKQPTLFSIRFHTKFNVPHSIAYTDPLTAGKVGTNWIYLLMNEHQAFKKEIKRALHLRRVPQSMALPHDMITVALHIRQGGGFDAPLGTGCFVNGHWRIPSDRAYPLKFPPEHYYSDQLIKIWEMFDNAPIFACIFTDDQDPNSLIDRFKQRLKNASVTLACAHSGHNSFKENILDDVYQMSRFDCLIKSASHFSWISQLIGDHKIIIYPQLATWDPLNKIANITKIGMLLHDGSSNVVYIPGELINDKHKLIAHSIITGRLK
jgi:hypothetical protein